ncbi:MAG: hypothetical protein DLM72_20190 [Candidatus Nitrosopolaris wilkensis]|nr:MAG: hypothetical protein DLM72_20190 [Candidatus Nitrosopolaris wilkensis]
MRSASLIGAGVLTKPVIPVNSGDNRSMFGSELADFVISCKWFDQLASIRDLITHNGAEPVSSYEDK